LEIQGNFSYSYVCGGQKDVFSPCNGYSKLLLLQVFFSKYHIIKKQWY